MDIAGGYYIERCASPPSEQAFGSGGRAALAVAQTGQKVTWHTYCPTAEQPNLRLLFGTSPIEIVCADSSALIEFRYFHPLSVPVVNPWPARQSPLLKIAAKHVLRFGFMEGDALVSADIAVYDPQSPNDPAMFHANGSTAQRLAVVLNSKEVQVLGRSSHEPDAVKQIFSKGKIEVLLVKAGTEGCRVYVEGEIFAVVPPYYSEKVYKIGSGDVFSATFAHQWMQQNIDPGKAADIASRCVARYCETRTPSASDDQPLNRLRAIRATKKGRIYLAGPFFTIAELWLIEEAWRALAELGASVFSPFHQVGLGKPEIVAPADIAALKKSTAVLCMLDGCDPGTIFEVGYARALGIPVIAFCENPKASDLTMLQGTGCKITDDFSTALYQATWASRE